MGNSDKTPQKDELKEALIAGVHGLSGSDLPTKGDIGIGKESAIEIGGGLDIKIKKIFIKV